MSSHGRGVASEAVIKRYNIVSMMFSLSRHAHGSAGEVLLCN